MKASKARRLKRAGWRIGSAGEFVGLSKEEATIVEMRLALGESMRERRLRQGISQAGLASRLGSSQSRVAKMEAADPTVSLDLLVRSLVALGAKPKDIAKAISG